MTKLKLIINSISSLTLSALAYFLGGIDASIKILLIVIAIDYITGVCKAIFNKEINSIIGVKGIIKKVGYLLIVGLSVVADNLVGESGAIRTLVIYFFVANEGISILENWGSMGLPLPKKIFEVFEQLKSKGDETN